jgi:hypothetical protein
VASTNQVHFSELLDQILDSTVQELALAKRINIVYGYRDIKSCDFGACLAEIHYSSTIGSDDSGCRRYKSL